jgi:hypothetical protein
MLEVLNTREWAILSWVTVIFIWLLCSKTHKLHVKNLWQVTTNSKLLRLYGIMLVYIGMEVTGLWLVQLWNIDQLKNTIVWTLTVAFLAMINVRKAQQYKAYYRETVKDLFSFAGFIEFLVGVHTLHYGVELIVVALGGLLPAMIYYASKQTKYKTTERALVKVFRALGTALFVYTLYWIGRHFTSFATTATILDFFVPLLLSILFLPFIYFLSIYMDYEIGFVGLRTALTDTELFPFAKKAAIKAFHFRSANFIRWKNSLFIHPVSTRQELLDSIAAIKATISTEKHPPIVAPTLGWSPYQAKDFLLEAGIDAGHYKDLGELGWAAMSNYIPVGDQNTISFYVEGTREVATSLKLVLSVTNPNAASNAHQKLIDYMRLLCRKACHKEIPPTFVAAMTDGHNIYEKDGHWQGCVVIERWPNHALHGYHVNVEIKMQ